MNIGNILNRRLGLVTIPNLQRVVNNLLETIGFVNDALPDSRPYKVYTALLSQTGTDDPVATVLENTLGVTITWSRTSSGDYEATASDDVFVENKTTAHGIITPAGDASTFTSYWIDTTTLQVVAISVNGSIEEATTDAPSFFEIRVYN